MWSLRCSGGRGSHLCGAHSTGKSPGLPWGWRQIQSWAPGLLPQTGGVAEQQAKGRLGSRSEATECVTTVKVTLVLVSLCFLNGKYCKSETGCVQVWPLTWG